ncbi:ABC transporter substrate-binding protein [Treponema sp.]|uniref:ABC transporter substrate-binding protein n=1 Tax=Treponema sp. TaxID=166 RepID=UPI0025D8669B|nr:ABC transporter substrate-binding protein [Treponema sp.]MCR5217147.1 ABC transporter substrate-binding protein [Treponema sp.]
MKAISRKVITAIIIAAICISTINLLMVRKNFSFTNKDTEKKENRIILGFSQIGSESAWRSRNTQSIFEAAEENDIQILFKDAQQKQENQLKAIRSFIVYQVDVIAFVPIVEDGWDNVLEDAKDAGIPVILVDRHINADPSLYTAYIGENGIEEGKKAAEFICSKFKKPGQYTPGKTGSKISDKKEINILEISGTSNSSVTKERAGGFRQVLKDNKGFNILCSQDGDFLRSRGKEITENLIKSSLNDKAFKTDGLYWNGIKIDAVYSHNDSMTLGLLDTIKNYGINLESTVIVSIDGEQLCIDALKEGKLNCVVECNPNLGPMLMELVKKISVNEAIQKNSYIEESIFTENDDFSLYTPRGY